MMALLERLISVCEFILLETWLLHCVFQSRYKIGLSNFQVLAVLRARD